MSDVRGVTTQGVEDVLTERQKQIEKGYTSDHDDKHSPAQILRYGGLIWHSFSRPQVVRLAACLIAAIDLMDRQAARESILREMKLQREYGNGNGTGETSK